MKKIIALLLVLVLAVSCFAGCVTNQPEDTKDTKPVDTKDTTPVDTTPTESDDPFDGTHEVVEVTVVIRNAPQEDDEQVVAAMNEILEERYNLRLNLIAVADAEYQDRITLMMTGNETWDWCYTASWTNNYWDRVSMGAFYDLNELMDTEIWAELMEVYPEGWYDNAIVDGHLYGIPNYQIEYSPTAVFVQKDLADKYELAYKNGDTITDVYDKDFYAWMERVRDGEPDTWVLRANAGSWAGAVMKETPAGSNWNGAYLNYDDNDYNVYWGMKENKETELDYYEKMIALIKDGFIREDVYTVTDDNADYKAGRYACWFSTGKPGGEVELSASMGEEYIMIYLNDGVYYRTATGGLTTVLGMNYASKNPEAALKFLTVMWKDVDLYNMFVHGLEGEHYKKVGENRVEPIADSGYSRSGYAWGFGNQFNAWLIPGQADDVWEQTIAMNTAAKPINVPGIRIAYTNVETEVGQYKTVTSEYSKQWMTCKDRAELEKWYDEYLTKQEEAGIEDIVAEVQAQIDAYCAANGK